MSGEDNFLKRWSRLKTKEKEEVKRPSSPVVSKSQEISVTDEKQKEIEEKIVAELPSIDSLTKNSDFTGFMRQGVPEALRQQALRKLWASDPTIGALDILDFQNVDFTHAVTDEIVATSYQIGKGYVDQIEAVVERIEGREVENASKLGEDKAEEPTAAIEPDDQGPGQDEERPDDRPATIRKA